MENNLEISRHKKVLLIACYVLFLTVFIIVMSELILRWKGVEPWRPIEIPMKVVPGGKLFENHPTLGYTNLPGRYTVTLADDYSFNVTNLPNHQRITHPLDSYGRDRPKDEIWIFGCSMTFGWSLNDQETFPWLLQQKFPEYEVSNFGVNGYGTVQSLIQFREELAKGRVPKVVFLDFAEFHDRRNIFSRNWQKVMIALRSFGQLFYPYARLGSDGQLHYYLGRVNFAPFPFITQSALMSFIEQKYDKMEERYYKMRDVTQALLLEFANTGKKEHIPVVIAGLTFGPGMSKTLSGLQEAGIRAIDISVDLRLREYTNYPHDAHPGPLATHKYADRLETYLRANLLPRELARPTN